MNRHQLQGWIAFALIVATVMVQAQLPEPSGSPCTQDSECTANIPGYNAYCQPDQGVCVPKKAQGDRCQDWNECSTGLVCAPPSSFRVVLWTSTEKQCLSAGNGAMVVLPWMLAVIVLVLLVCCCGGPLLCCCLRGVCCFRGRGRSRAYGREAPHRTSATPASPQHAYGRTGSMGPAAPQSMQQVHPVKTAGGIHAVPMPMPMPQPQQQQKPLHYAPPMHGRL